MNWFIGYVSYKQLKQTRYEYQSNEPFFFTSSVLSVNIAVRFLGFYQ